MSNYNNNETMKRALEKSFENNRGIYALMNQFDWCYPISKIALANLEGTLSIKTTQEMILKGN